jgi:hypothetical protein
VNVGDFNYPDISYRDYTLNAGSATDAYKFLTKTQDLFLVQHITEPTRVRAGNVPSVLDNVLTDEKI